MFKAIYLTQDEEKNVTATLSDVDEADLPDHNVAIDVEYSTINYKDGLAIMGKPGVVRNYPMIPGIDQLEPLLQAIAQTTVPATKSFSTVGMLARCIGAD